MRPRSRRVERRAERHTERHTARPERPPRRPMLVAHRGASSMEAEHTLAAYEAAIGTGADALECDVRLSRDGYLVCVHDRTVNRTSDGRGAVSDLDLPTLDSLDFSSWHRELPASADELLPDLSDQTGPNERTGPNEQTDPNESTYLAGVDADHVVRGGGVLTLELLLGLVHDAGRDVRLLVETKHPTRYGGLVEKTLVDLLAHFGWAGRPGPPTRLRDPADMSNRVVVMSFAPTAVRRVRLLAPDIPTVLLLDRLMPQRRAALLPAGIPIAGPGLHVIRADPGFVARAHSRGLDVYVWDVDEPTDVEFVLELGVDAVITDHPLEVRALLDDRF